MEVPLRSGIFVNIVILSPEMEITKTLPRKSYSKCGLIIDVKCSKAEIAVREVGLTMTGRHFEQSFLYYKNNLICRCLSVVPL